MRTLHKVTPRKMVSTKLGRAVETMASQPLSDFREHVVRKYISHALQEMVMVELAIDRFAPEFLRNGLEAWLSARREFLSMPNRIVPHLARYHDHNDAWQRTQEFVRSYATLLQSWPQIYSTASKLRGAGVRLSRSLNSRPVPISVTGACARH